MNEEIRARRAACTDTFLGNGLIRPRELLASIDSDTEPDTYGEGGVVTELEAHIAALLGKPAAVYLPSGTMAQAATLRVHADRRTSRTVAWHPYCHLEQHEGQAHQRLHQLVGRRAGELERPLTLDDLTEIAEPLAALLLELPQRDLGGTLPPWDDLVAQTEWARNRGAAVHLDGARLWEATAGYECTPADVAALFDTVYVSFYKGVGALPGCCVAGSEADVREVREWRSRLGGTLFAMWPGAASALRLVDEALAEMPARLRHARAIAEALAGVPEVRVVPDPPQTPMLHLLFSARPGTFQANAKRLAEETGLWVWPSGMATGDPAVIRTELSVGRATLRHKPEAIAEIIGGLCVDAPV
ncbi:threonine aldolase family protein [Actinoplanes sp. NPDC049681]|uniref:threonine aldolase family protein n=1 Tax=Actinoplanes sp. NPDC049681 TaxID=3363905 RepID=UPI003789F914